MKLNTNELKAFKSVASAITPNKILPILSYLKFDNGTITKNNLESFVTMNAQVDGCFLLDEKVLMSFVDSVDCKEIDVKIEGKTATLSNGKEKMKCPTGDVINFPVSSNGVHDATPLDEEVLEQIKIASKFTMERDNLPLAQCVFVGNGLVAASSGYTAYTKLVDKDLPIIVIGKEAATAISGFSQAEFSENETYQFYKKDVYRFGFAKTEVKFLDMKPFSIVPEGEKIAIDKQEIIRFCDACVNSSKSILVFASIEGDRMVMNDAAYEINYEKPLSVKLPEFTFNPAYMSKLLKSLPDSTVYFTKGIDKFFITGDSGFVSLIMEMQKI